MSCRLILIGWDAADWKIIRPLMAAGRMPNLRRLVENGASGPIATIHPPLSPMLWTSIATGKRPFGHGIHGFSEPTPDGRGVRAVTNLSRTSKAIWNILNQNGLRSVVVGWWPSHPAEPIDGVMISDQYHRACGPIDRDWPLPAGAVQPPELAGTLSGLRVHPDLLTPDIVEPFVPLAREVDQDYDIRLALLMRTLAECMSIQAAALWLIEHQRWDFFAVYYDSIDHFCHGFMKYHPPRQSWIAPRDYELYRHVVSMAYEFHDRMLGALLEKSDPDTRVAIVSDHGFHPDHLRPASIPRIPAGPAIEHRDLGILVVSGPGIGKGESLHGASILDIAPTILALYGLPVGEDMDGKVLIGAFADSPKVRVIPSWDDEVGADGCHPPDLRFDPWSGREVLRQLVALGYVEPLDGNRDVAVERTLRDLRCNLGEAYQDAGRHIEAYSIFSELCAAAPDEQRFAVRLFVSCQALGKHDEMQRIVQDLRDRPQLPIEQARISRGQPELMDYLKAQVLISGNRLPEALETLKRLPADCLQRGLLAEIGGIYLRLGRWAEALQTYKEALRTDPENAHAHLGMCRMALRRKKFRAAAGSAVRALKSLPHDPLAYFLLGRSLAGLERYAQAAEAFRAAIHYNPNFPEAHIQLSALLARRLGDAASAREHRRLA
ncbi:MAG TPA: alkaline phosphatase family protein, partial [Bryobacteraceae bacterium]|nr:alkaline phosphatase family protein [Bryobacteraceae bacterium]